MQVKPLLLCVLSPSQNSVIQAKSWSLLLEMREELGGGSDFKVH